MDKKMRKKRVSVIVAEFVVGGIFFLAGAATLAGLIFGAFTPTGLAFGMLLSLGGSSLLFKGAWLISQLKSCEKRILDPTTLVGKTYGGLGEYTHFSVIMYRNAQDSGNRAGNVVGAIAFVVTGTGVFGEGYKYKDAFVGKNELLICDFDTNTGLIDKKFIQIKSDDIEDITITIDDYVNARIVYKNRAYEISIADKMPNKEICEMFLALNPNRQTDAGESA